MYKKLLPSLLLIGSAATAIAQPTITATGVNPVIPDKFQLKICDTTGVNPGAGGTAVVWNFSSLAVTQTDTGKVVSCLSTPNCASYPGATIATTGPSLVGGISYLSTDATKRAQYGYWRATDTNLILSDPMEELHFPFAYPNSYTDNFSGLFKVGPVTAHHIGSVTVNADGYGVLMLPGRTDSNVLRVHSTQTFIDSAYIVGPVVLTYNINSYAWYKEGYHSALLTIITLTQVGSPSSTQKFVAFAPTQILGIPNSPAMTSLELFPNPATDLLNVKFNAIQNEDVTVTISDVMGRERIIASGTYSGSQSITYNTKSLAKGIYIVRLKTGQEIITKKMEIQ